MGGQLRFDRPNTLHYFKLVPPPPPPSYKPFLNIAIFLTLILWGGGGGGGEKEKGEVVEIKMIKEQEQFTS